MYPRIPLTAVDAAMTVEPESIVRQVSAQIKLQQILHPRIVMEKLFIPITILLIAVDVVMTAEKGNIVKPGSARIKRKRNYL